jgi:Domain of Unknown Function (DUF1259)
MKHRLSALLLAASIFPGGVLLHNAVAQEMPRDYAAVLNTLDKKGDFKDNVLKVNIPRNDVKVTVDGVATPTAFGFGGWVAMEKGQGGMDVMMGDLVLLESEVNPVMSALLDNGIEVTALHNHFFRETPRIFYMHVHAHGEARELARKLKPALSLMGSAPAPAAAPASPPFDSAKLAKIIGHEGEASGAVYKITIGRPDLSVREMGADINARMGLNTWAAFTGSDADAAIAGDIAMVENEIQPVLKELRRNGLSVVAIHNHMTGSSPAVYFLHYWGKGPAATLAEGFKAALDQTGKSGSRTSSLKR